MSVTIPAPISVFDAMELDNTHQRVASRRALALAHNRVEHHLGRFLRGAQNEDEFFERLGLVQEEFTGYVTTAAAEVGHEHPEYIAESLRDHYHMATQPVQFQETPEDTLEEEEKEDEKTSSVQIAPKKAKKTLKRMAKSGRTWTNAKATEGKQGSPLVESYNPGTQQDPAQGKVTCPECGGSGKTAGNSSCPKCGGSGKVENFGDPIAQAYTSRTAELTNDLPPGWFESRPNHVRILQEQGRQGPPPVDEYGRPIVQQEQAHPDPWMDNEPGTQTFPAEWAVPGGLSDGLRGPRDPENPYPYHTGAENQNNTDLDGPEPKMDKALWTRDNPGQPDYEDGKRHPTKQKDITEVIGPMSNESELSEISGTGDNCVKQDLPTQDGDDVFSPDGPSGVPKGGPHTDTWGNDGQVDPVTDRSLEAVQSNANPLSDLLMAKWPSDQALTAALSQP